MTTLAAEALYAAQHIFAHQGRPVAVFNPQGRPVADLPVIYGFNNGGSAGWLSAQLIAQDGTPLGGHCCSSECYMPADLGILEGTRQDRHETFQKHYPGGYRMDFVSYSYFKNHEGIKAAVAIAEAASAKERSDG
jgi:hypothetical protein